MQTPRFNTNPPLRPLVDGSPGPSAPRPLDLRTSEGGFSLIEILVVISIITLLVGISFPVALRMLGSASVPKARAMLNALGAATAEFRTETGGVPDHTDTSTGVVVSNDNTADTTIGLFLSRAMQVESSNKMARAAAGDKAFTANPGGLDTAAAANLMNNGALTNAQKLEAWAIVDPWDNRIRYAASVSHSDAFRDDDYLPPHPNAFFASAGPDGRWGTHDADGTPDADAEDNLYSFQVD
ncbi:MAG: prepilin-type N-terminal cleavage/methylation domain-containing protein [Planctomycetota bacterium]